jgi:hypothetical protein
MTKKVLLLLFATVALTTWNVLPAGEVAADKVKADYVYRIIDFVNWPQNSLTGARRPINICLMGEVEIQRWLYSLQNREVKKHIIQIKRISYFSHHTDCQILFIGNYSPRRMKEILQNIANQAVLTMSDYPGFVEMGGMIDFAKRGNSIRLEINLDAATKAGINISAKLAEVAINIIGGRERQKK